MGVAYVHPERDCPTRAGVGPAILKTTDAGKTWVDDETSSPPGLLLLDIAAHSDLSGDNLAVIGALSMLYSTDSAVTFNKSSGAIGAGRESWG